jgi:TonB family protein
VVQTSQIPCPQWFGEVNKGGKENNSMKKIITLLMPFCATLFAQQNGTFIDLRDNETDSVTSNFNNGKANVVLKNVSGLQTNGKTEMDGSGSLKPLSTKDIDMGNGDASRSKAEIMAVVSARMPGLRNIHNKYLKNEPGFSGKVTLKFTIAPSGDIISISIVSSTTGYSEFDNAVKNMVSTWKWKAIKSGNTTPTIPFDFTE